MALTFYLIVFAAPVFILLVTELSREMGYRAAEEILENRDSRSED